MLDKSNSHCYLCRRKHGPTTDTNMFNATALLIFRYTIDNKLQYQYTDIPLISTDNLQQSENKQCFGHAP